MLRFHWKLEIQLKMHFWGEWMFGFVTAGIFSDQELEIVDVPNKMCWNFKEKLRIEFGIHCDLDPRSMDWPHTHAIWILYVFVFGNMERRYYRLSTHFTKPYRFIVRNQTCVFSFTHSFGMCAKDFLLSFRSQFTDLIAPVHMEWGDASAYVCTSLFINQSTWTRTMDKVFDMYFSIVITAISRWDKSNRALAWHIRTDCTLVSRLTTKVCDAFQHMYVMFVWNYFDFEFILRRWPVVNVKCEVLRKISVALEKSFATQFSIEVAMPNVSTWVCVCKSVCISGMDNSICACYGSILMYFWNSRSNITN